MATLIAVVRTRHSYAGDTADSLIKTEAVSGEGIWIDPRIKISARFGCSPTKPDCYSGCQSLGHRNQHERKDSFQQHRLRLNSSERKRQACDSSSAKGKKANELPSATHRMGTFAWHAFREGVGVTTKIVTNLLIPHKSFCAC